MDLLLQVLRVVELCLTGSALIWPMGASRRLLAQSLATGRVCDMCSIHGRAHRVGAEGRHLAHRCLELGDASLERPLNAAQPPHMFGSRRRQVSVPQGVLCGADPRRATCRKVDDKSLECRDQHLFHLSHCQNSMPNPLLGRPSHLSHGLASATAFIGLSLTLYVRHRASSIWRNSSD